LADEACPIDAGVRPLQPLFLSSARVAYLFRPWRRDRGGEVEVISPLGVVELSPRTGQVTTVRPLDERDPWRAHFERGPHTLATRVRMGADLEHAWTTVDALQHVAWAVFLGETPLDTHRAEALAFADAWWSTLPTYEAEAQRALAPAFWRWLEALDPSGWPCR
jgi:hypothetical protein